VESGTRTSKKYGNQNAEIFSSLPLRLDLFRAKWSIEIIIFGGKGTIDTTGRAPYWGRSPQDFVLVSPSEGPSGCVFLSLACLSPGSFC
jgi:hypothetical protein